MGQRRGGLVRAGVRRAGAAPSSPASGVTTWQGTQGLTPTAATAGAVVAGQTLVAQWTVGVTRVYAVDNTSGNDANAGFADPASSSAADYAIACAAAGAVALKTVAGLAAILPRSGFGRSVEIVINADAVAYTGSLDTFMAGLTGYSAICVRATGTNATAGVVKFDGSAADCTYLGAATATGQNAAGYNPTGVPTTTLIQCLKVGGAAPAFAAEPALPSGLRIRFASTSATAALQNVCRYIAVVSGTDTIQITGTVLPAVPTAADVFFVEMPGVTFASPCLLGDDDITPASSKNLAGLAFLTGTSTFRDGRQILAFCRLNAVSATACRNLNFSQAYTHPVRGAITVGGTRVDTTWLVLGSIFSASALYVVGQAVVTALAYVNATQITGGCTFAAGISFSAAIGVIAPIGAASAPVGAGPRVIGASSPAGIALNASLTLLTQVAITNAGAFPAIDLRGTGMSLDMLSNNGQTVTGSTGNTNCGLSVEFATNCVVKVTTQTLPTVTGTNGDVKVAGGFFITWAQAAKGFVDIAGNRFVGSPVTAATAAGTRAPARKIPFSGSCIGGAGAVVSYLADTGPIAVNQIVPLRRPVSSVLMRALRVTSLVNTSANQTTVTLYKNGVATTMTVAIPAATAANTKFADLAHPIYFDDADDYDLRMDDAADVGGVVTVSGTLEYC